ncbi:MAG: hypothetical protein ACD_39C01896G0001, partial [uncultured bacterium]
MQTLYAELLSALSPQMRSSAPEFAIFNEHTPHYLDKICPAKTLSVSVTDHECRQKCAHCSGHYLKGMQMLSQLKTGTLRNYDAVLISGG